MTTHPSFLLDGEARRRHDAEVQRAYQPAAHPVPEVPARAAEPSEVPRGAKTLLALAEGAGWAVTPTYARGTVPSRNPHIVDSLALRMRRGRQRAWAVWEDGRFRAAHLWGANTPITGHTATSLRAALKEENVSFDWDNLADVPRDRYGRPLIVPPGGGKPVAYTRCTTFAGSVEDTYNLQRWTQRMVALGLAARPDLMASVAAHHDDKNELNKVCDLAVEAAKGRAAAGVGTALHKLTERVDRGEDLGPVPAEYVADLEAYRTTTAPLTVRGMERFVVQDDLKIGGTFDRLYEYQGKLYIGDTKTGNIEFGAGKIAMQLAIYANSVAYDHNGPTREYLGDVDKTKAIIVHLPAGEGRCSLRWVDIAAGWDAVQLAVEVRAWRARKGLHSPMDVVDAAVETLTQELGAEVISLTDQITAADSAAALEALWAANKAAWTAEHTEAAKARKLALHARSLRTVGAGR